MRLVQDRFLVIMVVSDVTEMSLIAGLGKKA